MHQEVAALGPPCSAIAFLTMSLSTAREAIFLCEREPPDFWLPPRLDLRHMEDRNGYNRKISRAARVSHFWNQCQYHQAASAVLRSGVTGLAAHSELWRGPEPRIFLSACRPLSGIRRRPTANPARTSAASRQAMRFVMYADILVIQ